MEGKEEMSSILLISDTEDPHLALVVPHLRKRGERPIVVDPARRPLTFALGGGSAALMYDGRGLNDAKSVLWRRPFELVRQLAEAHVKPEHVEFSVRAMREHIRLLRAGLPAALWVSDPLAIGRAENKRLQLEEAMAAGLPVPRTIITSDRDAAMGFLETQPATIIKPLCSGFVVSGGWRSGRRGWSRRRWPTARGSTGDRFVAFYARRVHGTDGVDLTQLRWGPSIFQQAIDAIADYRVTVVGEEVFVARIDADPAALGQPGLRDWRYHANERGQRFRAAVLPDGIRGGCLSVTRRLGLRFGAIDLVEARDGTVFFLEINPNGQWGFIEADTGLPIGAALADLLARR
jgi:hypothetical protein